MSLKSRKLPAEDAARALGFYEVRGEDFDPGHIALLWHVLGLAQMISTDIERIVRPLGLSAADLVLLGTIQVAAPDTLRPTDLAEKLHVSTAALSTRIARLVRLGFIKRRQRAHDRRAVELKLTDRGIKLADQAAEQVANQSAFACRYRQLPEDEAGAMARVLGKLHDLVDRDFLPTRRS